MPDEPKPEAEGLLPPGSLSPRASAPGGEELFLQVVTRLKAAARCLLKSHPPGHTLQPTALVNEAFLRMFGGAPRDWVDERHVLATACTAMRRVLIDHARRKGTDKRLPPGEQLPLDSVVLCYESRVVDFLALDHLLDLLEAADPEMTRVVELRFFIGLEIPEIAHHLGIPERTLQRRWKATKAWLLGRLK